MGRGSSKAGGGGGGKYTSPADFEAKLEAGKGFDDPDYAKFETAYNEGIKYNTGFESNLTYAINEGDDVKHILDSEEKQTKKDLNSLPKQKTASQIGEEMALQARLDLIEKLRKKKPSKTDVDIVVERR